MADPVRILVVEDDEAIRDMVAMVLSDSGYDVLSAEHGGAALALLDYPDNVAAIILDFRMPEMAAPEFMARFRARPEEQQRAIVILFTAAADAGQLARDLGLSRSLAKPAKISTILRAVAEALDTDDARAASPT